MQRKLHAGLSPRNGCVWTPCGRGYLPNEPPYRRVNTPFRSQALILCLVAAAACNWNEGARGHSSVATGHLQHADSVSFGGPQHRAADSARGLAKHDPDLLLLERLLDTYVGTDYLTDELARRKGLAIQGTAWRQDRDEHASVALLRDALADAFHQRFLPEPEPGLGTLVDSIAKLSEKGQQQSALANALRERHAAAVETIDSLRPMLRKPSVIAIADRLREELSADVQAMRRSR
jgi:hypothetical protein